MFEQSSGHQIEYRGPDFFHIVVFYEDIGAPVAATSYLKEGDDTSLCVVHGEDQDQIQSTIRMDSRGDWFTQADSERAKWEACPNGGSDPSCSKTVDFDYVFMHELGHAVGLAHPVDVDAHTGIYRGAQEDANCREPAIRAAMCRGIANYSTNGRTVDSFDASSLPSLSRSGEAGSTGRSPE